MRVAVEIRSSVMLVSAPDLVSVDVAVVVVVAVPHDLLGTCSEGHKFDFVLRFEVNSYGHVGMVSYPKADYQYLVHISFTTN